MEKNSRPGKAAYLPQGIRTAPPAPLKTIAKTVLCSATDIVDSVTGRRQALIPPTRLRVRVGCFFDYINARTFTAVGEEFLTYLVVHGGLTPSSAVLDVGCGCGQLAAPLIDVIGDTGSYDGLDIDAEALAWCREAIGQRHANFQFSHADVANGYYRAEAQGSSAGYRFPYDDEAFDLVFLKSLFTHMVTDEAHAYLAEIARVLKPGGKCLITYYVMNDETRENIDNGNSALAFQYEDNGCYYLDPAVPEYSLAYDETLLRQLYADCALTIDEPLLYGAWSGHADPLSYQDIVVATKPTRDASH